MATEDNPMPISDAQLEAMAIEQRNAILNDTTDIVPAKTDAFMEWYREIEEWYPGLPADDGWDGANWTSETGLLNCLDPERKP